MSDKKDTSLIPKGPYCYHGSRSPSDPNYKPCPYWEMKSNDTDDAYGYCHFLEVGDLDFTRKIAVLKKGKPTEYVEVSGSGLLWDQVKECSENLDYEGDTSDD